MKQIDLHEPEHAVAAAVASAHATGMPAAAAESSPAGGAGAPSAALTAPPE